MGIFDDPDTTTLTKPKVKKPSMYGVVIYNDDFTEMDFVVSLLIAVFVMNKTEATSVMLEIHHKGRAKVGQYTCEVAEMKAAQVIERARKNGHPLLASIEPI